MDKTAVLPNLNRGMHHVFCLWLKALGRGGLILTACYACCACATEVSWPELQLPLSTRSRTHDPSNIVRCGDEYWYFATGMGVVSHRSTDRLKWQAGPPIFKQPPAWALDVVPAHRGYFWAPEVVQDGPEYRVYYSVSSWGKNRSAIGLATARNLDPAHPDYGWKDEGIVVESHASDDYNAIDPHVFIDSDGKHWLTFGSFWSGIKLLQLDSKTGKRAGNSPLLALATHREIEAPALTRHGEFYYLFINWGLCCRGTNSTYEIRVGRSLSVTGPYVDKEGRGLRSGGGSLFLGSSGPAIGPGHAAFHRTSEGTWLTCHYYDGANSGRPRLAILPLGWDTDGWPVVRTNSVVGVRGAGPTR